jgi:hypothetical protein
VLVLVAGLAASPARATEAPRPTAVSAESLTEIAGTAHALAVGQRLRLDGVVLADGWGETLELDLERFEVFTRDAVVVVHGDGDSEEHLPAPTHAYFRGRVAGEPSSLALLTVLDDGRVHGFLRRQGEMLALVPEVPESPQTLAGAKAAGGPRGLVAVSPTVTKGEEAPQFECALDDLSVPDVVARLEQEAQRLVFSTADTPDVGAPVIEKMLSQHTAQVAVETDWELFQSLGGATQIAEYVGDLFAFASSLYDDEIDTNLVVSHLSTWSTSSDPWTETGASCALYQFGRYWNDNRGNIERTIAHFVAGKGSSSGVAWVGVLCRGAFDVNIGTACPGLSPQIDNYGGAYGYTGSIDGNFNPASPNKVWDIIAVSHEIGHNFNSPHTHCYNGLGGNANPVDQCYNGEAYRGCYSGSQTLPGPAGGSSGTIMSYCHLLGGGLSNIAFTFGTGHQYGVLPGRVPERMRDHVDATASSNAICLARTGGCGETIALENDTVFGTETITSCGTITAGNNYTVASSGDLTLEATTVALQDGFSVLGNGSLAVNTQ